MIRRLCLTFVLSVVFLAPSFSQPPSKPPLPTTLADLESVEQDDRILKSAPTLDIRVDGTVILQFETLVASPGARVSLGQLNPDEALDTVFYRFDMREEQKEGPTTSHRISFDLKRLETGPQNSADSLAHDTDVYYRLEIYDPRTAGAKYFESRFHYFGEHGRYEKRTTILYGPYVDQVTAGGAIISWTTDRPSRGVVELLSADGKTKVKSFLGEPTAKTQQQIKISGLQPGMAYRYQVLVFDPSADTPVNTSRAYRFHAAPVKGQKFQFVFMSDGRPSPGGGFSNFGGVNAAVTEQFLLDGYRRGADLILFGGDLSAGYTSSVENFDMMLNMWKHISDPVGHVLPIYEGFGNHESLQEFYIDQAGNRYHRDKPGEVNAESEFARHFANPQEDFPAPEVFNGVKGPSYRGTTYSFDYGNAHFVMLNMDYSFTGGGPGRNNALAWKILGGNREGYIMNNQMKWLEKDLAAARKRGIDHIFICGHDMAFPTGGHAYDAMWWNGLNDPSIPVGDVLAMKERFMKLVNRYRVTALLFGHEHNYSRMIIDHTVDPVMQHSVTQFVSGGAGAPFYPADTTVPWKHAVKKFSMTHHYLMLTVEGAKVSFAAIGRNGFIIDRGVLTTGKQ